jgi:hypothetical protein
MAKRQLTKNLHPVITFEKKGDSFTGKVKDIRREVKTQFGVCDLVDLEDSKGDVQSLFLGAALRLFDFNSLQGETIEVKYIGTVSNPKTKLKYQDFEVYVIEPDSEEADSE